MTPRVLLFVVLAGVVTIPLFLFPGPDAFRFPKEMVLRVEAIVLAALAASWWILGKLDVDRRELLRKPLTIWLLAVLGWSTLTTLTAENRLVSAASLAYIVAMSVVFVATLVVSRERGMWLAAVPLAPAIVNGVVLFLQVTGRQPLKLTHDDPRITQTALIGNPNDVGSYLMVVALAATALALSSKRWRWPAVLAALFLIGATFASATLTAIGGLLVGLFAIAAVRSWKLALAAALASGVLVFAAFAYYPPLQHRVQRAREAVDAKDWDVLLSYRFAGYATAWLMAKDHPLLGVGPGGYGWQYFDYRQKAEERWARLRRSGGRQFNFAEAHNDHLQTLAQTGVVGYLLLLGALGLLARVSLRRGAPAPSEHTLFARTLALPLVAAFAVLAIAQFPLSLTAVLHTIATYAAMVLAWGGEA